LHRIDHLGLDVYGAAKCLAETTQRGALTPFDVRRVTVGQPLRDLFGGALLVGDGSGHCSHLFGGGKNRRMWPGLSSGALDYRPGKLLVSEQVELH
jgi:hypothetical protein